MESIALPALSWPDKLSLFEITSSRKVAVQLRSIIERAYGQACAGERTMAVLETAAEWAVTGNVRPFAPRVRGNFHHPPSQTAEYWIDLVLRLRQARHNKRALKQIMEEAPLQVSR